MLVSVSGWIGRTAPPTSRKSSDFIVAVKFVKNKWRKKGVWGGGRRKTCPKERNESKAA